MGDSDLDAWRAKRMAEIQAHSQPSQNANVEEQKRAAEEMKNSILSQVLSQSARARLNTLLIGKPEKGEIVQNTLLRMAQTGQIMGKLQEEDLIGLIERVNKSYDSNKKTTVKFDRRRAALDSDDDI